MSKTAILLVAALMGFTVSSCTDKPTDNPTTHSPSFQEPQQPASQATTVVRFATFNASLNRRRDGQLLEELQSGQSKQIQQVAEVIQRTRPHVLLINEFDYESSGQALKLFREMFLQQSQNGQPPITYAHAFAMPVNTGELSQVDVNQDGKVELPNDGFGFGAFAGQYGMVVLSQYPIDAENVRTFQKFLWKDMPDALRPKDPDSESYYYTDQEFDQLRLSSKSHWDLPIQIDDNTVHFICAHPTPPVFDGPEDRNGCRNHDEIRMIADYLNDQADYLYDDQGVKGGLSTDQSFVVVGDMNADPVDGDSTNQAVRLLTEHARVSKHPAPQSRGAVEAAEKSGRKNKQHQGKHANDTGDFNDFSVGNVRIDYCLPSSDLKIEKSGVYWPAEDEEGFQLNKASDHHLVWVDLNLGD